MKYSKEIQDKYCCEILVAGGGPAGIAAALSAVRTGKSVILLEKLGAIGGAMTTSDVTTFMGEGTKGGICDEIARLVGAPDTGTAIDKEKAKYELLGLLKKEGVKVLLYTTLVDVILDKQHIQRAVVLFPDGVYAIKADVFIDSTGDGLLAFSAGVPFSYGRDEDSLVQPVSTMFHVEGVDTHCTLHCRHEEDDFSLSNGKNYLETCRVAEKKGELPENVSIVRLYPSIKKGCYLINATQICGVCTLDNESLTVATYELYEQKEKVLAFLRANVPGFEKCYISSSAETIGIRESRRFEGVYTLTAEDIINACTFYDSIAHNVSFSIDIHNPAGGGQAESEGLPVQIQKYDIPMRCLQPKLVDNLVLSGRNISGTHRAHASYRVMRIASSIGQAAGAMAATMIEMGICVQKLDYMKVRELLEKQGCKL